MLSPLLNEYLSSYLLMSEIGKKVRESQGKLRMIGNRLTIKHLIYVVSNFWGLMKMT